jgi:hypothetical protein
MIFFPDPWSATGALGAAKNNLLKPKYAPWSSIVASSTSCNVDDKSEVANGCGPGQPDQFPILPGFPSCLPCIIGPIHVPYLGPAFYPRPAEYAGMLRLGQSSWSPSGPYRPSSGFHWRRMRVTWSSRHAPFLKFKQYHARIRRAVRSLTTTLAGRKTSLPRR